MRLLLAAALLPFLGALAAAQPAEPPLPPPSAGPVPGLADQVRQTTSPYTAPKRPDYQAYSPLGLACEVKLTAHAAPGAMAVLQLHAPCLPNRALTVRHQGLVFSDTTSNIGTFTATVPALTSQATFELKLADAAAVITSLSLPEAAHFRRVGLQWSGSDDLQLHVFELNARSGRKTHLWAGQPQSTARALRGRGGYLTRLGNAHMADAHQAEIYSFPAGRVHHRTTIRLHLVVPVTRSNCDQALAAQTLHGTSGGGDISIRMPPCDQIGTDLVLKNLLKDLKISGDQG